MSTKKQFSIVDYSSHDVRQVTQADRKWFAKNPGRNHRFRKAFLIEVDIFSEFITPKRGNLPEGLVICTVVRKTDKGNLTITRGLKWNPKLARSEKYIESLYNFLDSIHLLA